MIDSTDSSLRVQSRLAVVALLLLCSPKLLAQGQGGESGVIQDHTGDFLSDPGRSGTIVGSVLGGAMYAHPLAPIVGSVVGYFIGSSTDDTEENGTPAQRYARRSIIPEGSNQVASIELSGQPGETTILGIVTPATATGTGHLQLANACTQLAPGLPLPTFCYYFSAANSLSE